MKYGKGGVFAIVLLVCSQFAFSASQSFDADWRFSKGDAKGGEAVAFDDSGWTKVDVPHDWAIDGEFDQSAPERGSGAFLRTGVGWYRKHFDLPPDAKGKHVFIDFDGVMANSDVYLNGHLLGHRPYGYSSFRYDLTPNLAAQNVIAVRCDDSQQPASRWYAGAGIYRHVRLVVTEPVHFEHWGNFVTTPKVSENQAIVHVRSTVVNTSEAPLETDVVASISAVNGQPQVETAYRLPRQKIGRGESATFEGDIVVDHPQLWDLDHPNLYSVTIEIPGSSHAADDPVLDRQTIPIGIRQFQFKPDTGFWLNGKNFKLKGVCVHSEGGPFGAAVPVGMWERRLKALKELGANAIRTAHNPPDPTFLDLCDRLGFLVMDETFDCWTVGKNPYDYHLYFKDWYTTDARDMVLRDRNHPSIVLYSAGNEIHDTPKADIAKPILAELVKVMHEADPTRPVTQALFRPNVSHDYDNGLAAMLDVVGTNYRDNEVIAANAAHPTWPIVGTENRHDLASWLAVRDNPQYCGQFLWTGVDYLGESRAWPVIGAGSGLVDRDGTPKTRGWERQSWWSEKPMVKISRRVAPTQRTGMDPGFEPLTRLQAQFCDWTPAKLDPHEETVEVYSNCDDVELMLNDKSLGTKSKPKDGSARIWKVNFEPGSIKAVAKNDDKIVATTELQTAGKPAKILLTTGNQSLRPDWDDVAFVQATIVDEKGVPVPRADDLVTFNLTGPGATAAVDNADNASHESFRGNQRHAFQGVCYAMVKATDKTGPIQLEATADGLTAGTISIAAGEGKK